MKSPFILLHRALRSILANFPYTQYHMLSAATARSTDSGLLSRAYMEHTRREIDEKALYEADLEPTPVFGTITIDEAIADLESRSP